MHSIQKLMFVVCFVALCWYGMQASHELGHVIGAAITGGTVTRVHLPPFGISHTDVSPNPSPGLVVWLGPVTGAILPLLLLLLLVNSRRSHLRKPAEFFAGFCLIANGAYIAGGAADGIGDCGIMRQCGAAVWMLVAFGVVTIPVGLLLWHRLGSVTEWTAAERPESLRMFPAIALALLLWLLAQSKLFP